jgi:multidrug efflux system membrane fusion protein
MAEYPHETDPSHALPPAGPGEATITDPHHMLPATATPEPARKRGPWLTRILLLLVVLIIAGVVIWRIHSNNEQKAADAQKAAAAASRAVPVQTSAVQIKTVPIYLTALGTVTPYNTVTLHTRVDGQLLQVNFHEGQAVRQGQLLLQIDPRPYQAAVDQALGTLAKDQANLKNTQAEAQRYTALYEAGVVSKESQQAQVSGEGQAAGSIQADQAAIEAAKVNLGYTRIYSPINGIVGLRQVDPGNIVHAADTTGLVVITQVHPIAIIFTLPEDQLPQVQEAMKGGKKLTVIAYDRSDSHQLATGTLLTIDNEIDTTTGTAKLKAVFDNADGTLFANQFVNVRLVLNDRQNAVVIPTAAVQTGTQGTYVFVVHSGPTPANKRQNVPGSKPAATGSAPAAADDANTGKDGKPRQQFHADAVAIKIDFAQGATSILAPGTLKNGDAVVVDGQQGLVDGSNVTPQAAPPGNSNPNNNANDTVASPSGGPGSSGNGGQ